MVSLIDVRRVSRGGVVWPNRVEAWIIVESDDDIRHRTRKLMILFDMH